MINISKGKKKKPIMAAIYGVEGVGKTCLAAGLPGALIVDIEHGSTHYDVSRIDDVNTWSDLIGLIQDVVKAPDELHSHGIHTIIFDSVDAIENMMLIPYVMKMNGKPGGALADFDWGRGYELEANEFKLFLRGCDALMQAGFNTVLIVHCQQKEVNPPELQPYSHYELKLNKRLCALVKERADMLLFATYDTYLIRQGNASKARDAKRVLICNHMAYADAKNRFGLPDKIDLDPDKLAPFFLVPDEAGKK